MGGPVRDWHVRYFAMKRSALLFTLLLLAGSRLACGQAAQSLGLEVQPVSGGAAVQSTVTTKQAPAARTSTASSVHVTRAQETLQLNVRNFGPVPTNAKVQWYFVAAPVHPSPDKPADDQEFVFDQGAKDLTLPGGGSQMITAQSAEVTSSKKVSASRSRRVSSPSATQKPAETGSALHGWLARVVVNGQTVAARGSTDVYQEIAGDDTSLQALLAGAPPKEARSKKQKK